MNNNRDSFDHRFGDDLFAEIFSYLPIVDKMRFESLCKRFERLVFDKQKVLRAVVINGEECPEELETTPFVCHFNFVRILRKFRFITEIDVSIDMDTTGWTYYTNLTEVLDTITENCNHLTSIRMNFKGVELTTILKFSQKFGQQLKHIVLHMNTGVDVFLQNSPNLLSIRYLWLDQLNYELLSKKLVKIDPLNAYNRDYNGYGNELIQDQLQALKQLKNLEYLNLFVDFDSELKTDFVKELSKLKILKISFFSQIFCQNLDTIIESIATNCLHLEEFSLDSCNFNTTCDPNYCIRSLAQISGLKRLLFRVRKEITVTDLSALKNCKKLISLDLCLISYKVLNEIDLIVPQLRQLSFEFNGSLTHRVLESIANLKNLTHLKFKALPIGGNEFTSKAIKHIINGCKRLKFLKISANFDQKSHEKFNVIELMAQHKSIEFKLSLYLVSIND